MSVESEWDRVKDNPDNIIVSDELRDLLDPKELGDITDQPQSVGYFVEIGLQDPAEPGPEASQLFVSGPLLSFSKDDKEICCMVALDAADASPFLTGARLVALTVTDALETFTRTIEMVWGKDPEESYDLDFTALGEIPSPTVLLTMSIPLSAE